MLYILNENEMKVKDFLRIRYVIRVVCGMILVVAGSLGTLNAKITNLNFGRARVGILKPYAGLRTWTGQKPQLYSCLSTTRRSEKVLLVRSGPSLETLCKFFSLMCLFAFPLQVIHPVLNLAIVTRDINFVVDMYMLLYEIPCFFSAEEICVGSLY